MKKATRLAYRAKRFFAIFIFCSLAFYGCSHTQSQQLEDRKASLEEAEVNSSVQNTAKSEISSASASNPEKAGSLSESASCPGITKADVLNGIQIEESQLIQNNHLSDQTLYFQTLDPSISYLYPTVSQYKYDFQSGEQQLVKSRNPESNERVWDFFEKDGKLYESVISADEKNYYCSITVNGKEICHFILQDLMLAPSFGTFEDNVLVFLRSVENGVPVDSLSNINDRDEIENLWCSLDSGNTETLYLTSSFTDDYSVPVFITQTKDGYSLYFYQNKSLQAVPCPVEASKLIPLEDGVILARRNPESIRDFQYDYLPYGTSEFVPLISSEGVLGQKNFGSAFSHSLLFVDFDATTNQAWLEDNTLYTSGISQLPAGISNYWRLNDSSALVFIEETPSASTDLTKPSRQYFILSGCLN